MCNLLARCLLRDWGFKTRKCNVQSLSTLSPKRLGIRMANVLSRVTFWATVGEGQEIQDITRACTALKYYDLYTPNNYEELTFSAVRGPCNNISGISERNVMIEIICSCPIGFQKLSNSTNESSCDCVCNQVLQRYEKTECDPRIESIIRKENFWISYIIKLKWLCNLPTLPL